MSYTYAPQLNVTASPGPLTKVAASVIPALCIAYEITYACMGDNMKDLAEGIAATFNGLLILANGALLALQKADQDKFDTDHVVAARNGDSDPRETIFGILIPHAAAGCG